MTVQTMTYRCPHCQTPVEVDPTLANEMLTCPSEGCGKPFKTAVPNAQPVAPIRLADGQELAAPPAEAATPVASTETDLQAVHLAMVRRFPLRCLVYGLLVVAGLLGLVAGLVNGWPVLWIASVALLAFTIYRVAAWWLRNENTVLRITNRRCILENGVFAKEAVEVPRGDITDLRVHQSLLGRLLNVCDMVIHTNGGETKRIIQVMAVPDPEAVARLIRHRPVNS